MADPVLAAAVARNGTLLNEFITPSFISDPWNSFGALVITWVSQVRMPTYLFFGRRGLANLFFETLHARRSQSTGQHNI